MSDKIIFNNKTYNIDNTNNYTPLENIPKDNPKDLVKTVNDYINKIQKYSEINPYIILSDILALGKLVANDDPRLTDDRKPLHHTHTKDDIIKGDESSSVNKTMIAGEPIGGGTVVRLAEGGTVLKADSSDITYIHSILGITTNAANANDYIQVRNAGDLSDPSFNFEPNLPLFYDTLGRLTQDIPISGYIQTVGLAMTPTDIHILIQIPIKL